MDKFIDKLKKNQNVLIVITHLFAFNMLATNSIVAQCDPASIDLCETGKNSIIQASYHAQIINKD